MTGTNHGLTGAAIALAVQQPLLAVPLALTSHFACDAIPHFGLSPRLTFKKPFNIYLAIDAFLAAAAMVALGVLFPAQRWTIWACMVAAACPDVAWLYYFGYVKNIKKRVMRLDPISRFHLYIQWSETIPGIIVELIWASSMIFIISAFK